MTDTPSDGRLTSATVIEPHTPITVMVRTHALQALEVLFTRQRPAWTIAIVRIAFGLVVAAWTLTMMVDVGALLGSDAIVPTEFATTDRWSVFALDSTAAVWAAITVLLVASIAVTIGWRPTEWLVVTFVMLVAIQRRNPVILNSGDLLLRNVALILVFCPTGAALSVDRWRRFGKAALWSAPNIAPWGLRLLQLQVMVVYFFAFWSKSGDTWRGGTAVSTALRLTDLQRFDAPDWLVGNVTIIALLTWGALAIEIALATLLWVKPLRPALIALGFVLHFFIDIFLLVGFFGPMMMLGLFSFADAAWIDRRVRRSIAGKTLDGSSVTETDIETTPDNSRGDDPGDGVMPTLRA